MGREIIITVNEESFEGELNETDTAKLIGDNLPIEASPSFWGEEIYSY
ncbi:MAG: cyclophilin-like family protein [Candidatus Bipolaricaulota bacterium]